MERIYENIRQTWIFDPLLLRCLKGNQRSLQKSTLYSLQLYTPFQPPQWGGKYWQSHDFLEVANPDAGDFWVGAWSAGGPLVVNSSEHVYSRGLKS